MPQFSSGCSGASAVYRTRHLGKDHHLHYEKGVLDIVTVAGLQARALAYATKTNGKMSHGNAAAFCLAVPPCGLTDGIRTNGIRFAG